MAVDRTPLNVITLRSGDASPTTIILRALPVVIITGTSIFLHQFNATPTTIILRDTTIPYASPGFPTQFAGLRFFSGSVKELCLVAEADAPSGMGGVWKVRKGGTTYAVYLVDTTDGNASSIRVRTTSGTKAARLKT